MHVLMNRIGKKYRKLLLLLLLLSIQIDHGLRVTTTVTNLLSNEN